MQTNKKGTGRKRIVMIVFILLIVCIMLLFALQKLRGHGYFSAVKNYIRYVLNKPDFTQYEPMQETESAWYLDNHVIAHALGAVDTAEYTNSKEALAQSLKKGYHVFEADFSVTADKKAVCAHDFQSFEGIIPDYAAFMATKIAGNYTPMDMEELICVLAQNPDMYLMTDFKWDNSFGSSNNDVEIIMDALTSYIDAYDEPELFDRVIIQIYSGENYHFIADNYPYKNYVYTLYQYAYPIYDEVAAFCLENNIPVVTMSLDRATREHVAIYEQWNIKVFSHTINDVEEAARQIDNGVWGIYTDIIIPEEMENL